MLTDEIKLGSLSVSEAAHELLSSLVFDEARPSDDRPFTSIVESFRFAFALGFSLNKRARPGSVSVSPRQFIVGDYDVILRGSCLEEGLSLGGLCSEYAEGGCKVIQDHLNDGGTVLELVE
jgi:hypothetical protein